MKDTTFQLICVNIGCALGALTDAYLSTHNYTQSIVTIFEITMGIWLSYIVVRTNNNEIK